MPHGHGPAPLLDKCWVDELEDPSSYGGPFLSHIGGPPKREDRYQGCGSGQWVKTKELLSHLAIRMSYGEYDGQGARLNPSIPAGYTYLAQLVAHDIVATGMPFPSGCRNARDIRNFRGLPLALECIYGGGPDLTPAPYEPRHNHHASRRRLRLGKTRVVDQDIPNWVERDIPRVACPYLTAHDASGPDDELYKYPTDDLLADSRNGDNLILSQITALFHEFHNQVLDKVDEQLPPGTGGDAIRLERRNFEFARGIVLRAYRRIVRSDLLCRILNKDIWECYNSKTDLSQFVDSASAHDSRIPVEFSHAAFRFGHAMVHDEYFLNDDQERIITSQVVSFTTARDRSEMPLDCSWLVDHWWRFFAIAGEDEPNPSRLLTPHIADEMVANSHFRAEDGNAGGLVYRDLVRAAAVGVRTVSSLLRLFGLDQTPGYRLGNPKDRRDAICTWLSRYPGQITEDERKEISNNPPLLFFILFEAFHGAKERGAVLGKLGSMLIAEVVFAALMRTRYLDETTAEEAQLERVLFLGGVLDSMPSLVKWLGLARDWGGCPTKP